MTYVPHNDGTDDAEDVTLSAGDVDLEMVAPDFRSLPARVTVHAHGSHEFYCDPATGGTLPRLAPVRAHQLPKSANAWSLVVLGGEEASPEAPYTTGPAQWHLLPGQEPRCRVAVSAAVRAAVNRASV